MKNNCGWGKDRLGLNWDLIFKFILTIFLVISCIIGIFILVQDLRTKMVERENAILENRLRKQYNEQITALYADLGGRDYVEKKRNIEKVKEEEKKRREAVEYTQKHYKKGDHIKFYDTENIVSENDKYRLDIIDIGTITYVIGDKIYGDWGDNYITIDTGNWGKVESRREWKDLVYMSLNGQLREHKS